MGNEWCPNGWTIVKLRDLGEVNRGRSRHRPRYAEYLYGGPYPFIQTGDVKQSGGRVTTYQQTYSEEGLSQSRLWPTGTMCITIAANIAETGILQFPACFPDSIIGFIAIENRCDVYFVEYMFRHLKQRIQHEATGSVQDNINLATLDRLTFPLPPIHQQRAIAHILGSLDDKIELNRKMNRTLEKMAQAIFKSWFIDFDPVRAKAEGRDPGLPKDIADLFPDSFEDSELGKIPKGWEVGSLWDFSNLNANTWTRTTLPDEVHYVDLANTKDGSILAIQAQKKEAAPSRARRILQSGDTIFGTVRPGNRSFALVGGTSRQLTGSTGFAVLTPKDKNNREYVYLQTTKKQNITRLARLADGAAYPAVRPNVVADTKCVVPTSELMPSFHSFAGPLFDKIHENNLVSLALARARDTLLPKLVSGELPIPDAEKVLEEAEV